MFVCSCGQSLHRFSKSWSEFQICKTVAKLWFRFFKVWLPLNDLTGTTLLEREPKFGHLSESLELIFTPCPLLPLVTFNGSYTFKKRSQSLATFQGIWNCGQHLENRCKLWPQLWSLLFWILCKIIICQLFLIVLPLICWENKFPFGCMSTIWGFCKYLCSTFITLLGITEINYIKWFAGSSKNLVLILLLG